MRIGIFYLRDIKIIYRIGEIQTPLDIVFLRHTKNGFLRFAPLEKCLTTFLLTNDRFFS